MEVKWLNEKIEYTGENLRPRWCYLKTGIIGDCCVGWEGRCDVKKEFICDVEELRVAEGYSKGCSEIRADRMIHFIVESFKFKEGIVLLQRLLLVVVKEVIESLTDFQIERLGGDLYFRGKKMTVSVAVVGVDSGLIHLGMNVDGKGVPEGLVVSSLADVGIRDVERFGNIVLGRFKAEVEDCEKDRYKTRLSKI